MKRQLRNSVSKHVIRNETLESRLSPHGVLSGCEPDGEAASPQRGTATVEGPAKDTGTMVRPGPAEPHSKSRRIDGEGDREASDEPGSPITTGHPGSPLGTTVQEPPNANRASAVIRIENEMSSQLPRASFISGKVTHVYNPLEHAAVPHAHYVRRCLGHGGGVPFLMMGMNPGPWGMSQTGVPFGEVTAVRDWMGVGGEVVPPEGQNPQRLITGFNCSRSEVRLMEALLAYWAGWGYCLFR